MKGNKRLLSRFCVSDIGFAFLCRAIISGRFNAFFRRYEIPMRGFRKGMLEKMGENRRIRRTRGKVDAGNGRLQVWVYNKRAISEEEIARLLIICYCFIKRR